ncbi:MAG TPA: TrmH family RNA methyltransferase [Gammaproteobacteria bacterium]
MQKKPFPRRPQSARTTSPGKTVARELKYYGTAACRALWQQRPDDVIRIYIEQALIKPFADLLKWAATQRKAYHVVSSEELEKITESVHHQGICLLARDKPPTTFPSLLKRLQAEQQPQLLAYLDGVENPHNLGAIVRSCAHFGIHHILGEAGKLPRLSPSACRVAEGGAEFVELVALDQPLAQLKQLQQLGFSLLATAMQRGHDLYHYDFPKRTLLIFGAEEHGVSQAMFKAADATLHIPGSGHVESLNVSVAFALIAGEHYRQQKR